MSDQAAALEGAKDFGRLEARVGNLEGWQRAQNGSIKRVEAKVDRLIFWVMTVAVGELLAIGGGLLLFLLQRG